MLGGNYEVIFMNIHCGWCDIATGSLGKWSASGGGGGVLEAGKQMKDGQTICPITFIVPL